MIQVANLKKGYGLQLLFDEVSFALSKGEKVGLVGRNGFGKSTLFRLITKEEEADAGEIIVPANYRIGTLKQHIRFTKKNLLDECSQELMPQETHEQYRVEKILMGLGFKKEDFGLPPMSFSGGFQIRINLAKLLIQEPELLLLDEPTNYLDIVSIRWLKTFLRSFKGEFILITHDRGFMDEVTTHTMGIYRKRIKKIEGGTGKFYAQLKEEENHYEKTRVKQEQAVKHMQKYIDRFRATARRATQAQSRIKKLSRLKEMVELMPDEDLKFRFNYEKCPAKILVQYEDYSFTYPGMKKMLIEGFDLFVKQGDRIAIIGKNGAGKSTLLNLMAGEMKPLRGKSSAHPQAATGFFGQMNIERLHPQSTIEDEIGAENSELTYGQVKSICGLMLFDQDLSKKKIEVLSGGEKSRVLLGKILAKKVNVLLLDEPTNHLDQESIEALLNGFNDFEGAVILVTHSEMILRRFAKRFVVFKDNEVFVFEGEYDDFLRRVGWEDDDLLKRDKSTEQKKSKKEKRQQKALMVTEKSRLITPLKNKVDSIEKDINNKEKQVTEIKQKLVESSLEQKVDKTVQLSKSLSEIQNEIESLYHELDRATETYEAELKRFENMDKSL